MRSADASAPRSRAAPSAPPPRSRNEPVGSPSPRVYAALRARSFDQVAPGDRNGGEFGCPLVNFPDVREPHEAGGRARALEVAEGAGNSRTAIEHQARLFLAHLDEGRHIAPVAERQRSVLHVLREPRVGPEDDVPYAPNHGF